MTSSGIKDYSSSIFAVKYYCNYGSNNFGHTVSG